MPPGSRSSVGARTGWAAGTRRAGPVCGDRCTPRPAAGELLADARRHTVCACPGEHCGWLFLDQSGRRRFCSVATCGHPQPA
ncbi:CGNR zinc finger domain-containing protein [Micromonospora sp. NBC_01813]|uniref:CGNR zinc finger domain-containing protein n=1 Tax=Micromonospora sp. NBC_01813 TaxID=2975988 RepID=UPI002DD864C2|nr:CGNR zinc finger domain-containing protein [Micromonospora sp. NBC_01813]WSA08476.1 CGNR zinc finger domain-containing protein [Micromonospora sp. NBC_01813]